MANDKIKTLEKAIELIPKLPENEDNKRKTIINLSNKYQKMKNIVDKEWKRVEDARKNSGREGREMEQGGINYN